MRFFSKTAVAAAAAGIAVVGTIAASGGAANAATQQSVTGCSLNSTVLSGLGGLLGAGVAPTCDGPDSTVVNPTSITVTADPHYFTVLGITALAPLVGNLLGEDITYNLNCSVNGSTVTKPEAFTADASVPTESQTINLQSAVGSPVPNSCTVTDLKATSLLSLDGLILSALSNANVLSGLSFGATVTAHTAVSGAIYSSAGKAGSLTADICADDAGNGNSGAAVQVYQCNSDLAQYWIQASTGQLVRNGDCLAQAGSTIKLETCSTTNNAQVWAVNGTGGSKGTIVNQSTGKCLTWPKAVSFTQLTAAGCAFSSDQQWIAPAKSAV